MLATIKQLFLNLIFLARFIFDYLIENYKTILLGMVKWFSIVAVFLGAIVLFVFFSGSLDKRQLVLILLLIFMYFYFLDKMIDYFEFNRLASTIILLIIFLCTKNFIKDFLITNKILDSVIAGDFIHLIIILNELYFAFAVVAYYWKKFGERKK
jgi:hypothetical protein